MQKIAKKGSKWFDPAFAPKLWRGQAGRLLLSLPKGHHERSLHIKTDMNNISILDDISLAFNPHFTRVLNLSL